MPLPRSIPCGDVELHMDDPVYMFVGLDHFINDRLYLNVEGRTNFNDGWGIEGGIGYLFDICAKPAPPSWSPHRSSSLN